MRTRRPWSGALLPLLIAGLMAAVTAVASPALAQSTDDDAEGVEDEQAEAEQRPVMDGLTEGDLPWERAFDEAMLAGRDAYNAGDWEEAEEAFIRAIQSMPERPAAYRNLARTYNFMGNYRWATEYYDRYLRMAPEADDAEQIRLERRGTLARAGDDPWRLPGDQRLALRALRRELDEGRGVTAASGGAWGLFESLLEMNYAAEDIADLRRRLEQKIAAEFEAELAIDDGFLPVLTAEDWALQRERLVAVEELARSEDRLQAVERRRQIVDAASALLAGEYEQVLESADQVLERYDDGHYFGWYVVIALAEMGLHQDAIYVLDALVESDVFGPAGGQRAVVVRAQLMREIGDDEAAAQILRDAITR